MVPPPPQLLQGGTQEPVTIRLDQRCLYSPLKEFFAPLRTSDSRTDFYTMYHNESGEFDRDCARELDEDLNASLVFAVLFSAVNATFIAIIQPKLKPDPKKTIEVYLKILIHTMENTLFPNVDPDSITWTGPPPTIVTAQSLFYAGFAISSFAAFITMLGKSWVGQSLRNCTGSAADGHSDMQRKLDGLKRWYLPVAVGSLPVMLQLAMLLFGCAMGQYLWTINRTAAWVNIAFTLFGIASYTFFTLAAILYRDCPYQTPVSILIRALVGCLTRSDSASAHPVE